MTTLSAMLRRSLPVVFALLLGASSTSAQTELLMYDFVLPGTPQQNADYAKSLGFRGLVTRVKFPADIAKLSQYVAHAETLDDFRVMAYIPYDFNQGSSRYVWRTALPILARAGAPLWVVVRNAPNDEVIVRVLRTMAEDAQEQDVRVVVYPHFNMSISTAEQASTFIAAVDHPNLQNSLHSCHEIRGGNQYDMESVVEDYGHETAIVAIAGADDDAYAGPPSVLAQWSDCIKPLDNGDWSLLPFLQALEDEGYEGPVILQTFGIPGPLSHLEDSIVAYDEYLDQVVPAGG